MDEIIAQGFVWPRRSLGRPADQHIIPTGLPMGMQDLTRNGPQPALGAVARHRVADLLGTGESHPDRRIVIAPVAPLHHHRRRALTPRARSRKKIGPLA